MDDRNQRQSTFLTAINPKQGRRALPRTASKHFTDASFLGTWSVPEAGVHAGGTQSDAAVTKGHKPLLLVCRDDRNDVDLEVKNRHNSDNRCLHGQEGDYPRPKTRASTVSCGMSRKARGGNGASDRSFPCGACISTLSVRLLACQCFGQEHIEESINGSKTKKYSIHMLNYVDHTRTESCFRCAAQNRKLVTGKH